MLRATKSRFPSQSNLQFASLSLTGRLTPGDTHSLVTASVCLDLFLSNTVGNVWLERLGTPEIAPPMPEVVPRAVTPLRCLAHVGRQVSCKLLAGPNA